MKRKILAIVSAVASLCMLISCSDTEKRQEDIYVDDDTDIQNISENKDGQCHFGYFIQDAYVTDIDDGQYRLSTYDELEMSSICMDPVCRHSRDSVCTALTLRKGYFEDSDIGFSVVYNDKLIIISSFFYKINDSYWKWETEVYEAELDGSERKCMVSFDGSVQNNTTLNDTVILNGKIYFGGDISEIGKNSEDSEGKPIFDNEYRSAIFCIDLEDYTVKELVNYNEDAGVCNMYVYNDCVYISRTSENYTLYKVSDTNQCNIIFECNEAVILSGIIGNTLYYQYNDEDGNNDGNKIYKREIGSKSEELFLENCFHSVVIDEKIYVMEAGWTESCTKYSVYDKEGSLLETFEYDGYVYLCADVTDRIIYYTITAVGVVDKEDIKEALTKGKELGAPV